MNAKFIFTSFWCIFYFGILRYEKRFFTSPPVHNKKRKKKKKKNIFENDKFHNCTEKQLHKVHLLPLGPFLQSNTHINFHITNKSVTKLSAVAVKHVNFNSRGIVNASRPYIYYDASIIHCVNPNKSLALENPPRAFYFSRILNREVMLNIVCWKFQKKKKHLWLENYSNTQHLNNKNYLNFIYLC